MTSRTIREGVGDAGDPRVSSRDDARVGVGDGASGEPSTEHVRTVRIGSGANCSSVGSVVDTLFATAAVGAAVFAGVLAALGREPVRGRRAGDHVGGREPVRGPRAGDDVGGRERETEGAPLEGHPALERATPGGARARGERASGAAPPDPDEGDR